VITTEQIDAIERLAEIDAELSELNEELERERGALTGKQRQLHELDDRLGHDRQSLADMDRMRGDLMQELRQMSQQIEKAREKLGRCRTEREANAAQRELEELRKLYRDREVEVEKLSVLSEQARGEIAVAEGQRSELANDLGATGDEVEGHLGETEAQVKARGSVRAEAAARLAKLDMKLYRRYELLVKRRGTAVAHSDDGACSACHVRMPPQQFQRLMRREEFGQCPNCNRIIYFREAVEGSDAEGQAADNPATSP